MRKYILSVVCALTFSAFTFAQSGLNLGFSFGFPYENYDGYDFSFAFSGDINYLFEVSEAFDIGLASGYGHALGRSYYVGPIVGNIDTPDYQYVPVALAARINANQRLTFGADIGYAISVTSAKDLANNKYYEGGFYWRPMIGFNVNEKIQLNANYVGISDPYFYYSTVNIGLTVNIN
mgnify:CR=1 FL=1